MMKLKKIIIVSIFSFILLPWVVKAEVKELNGTITLNRQNTSINLATYLGINDFTMIEVATDNDEIVTINEFGILSLLNTGSTSMQGKIYSNSDEYNLNLDLYIIDDYKYVIYGNDIVNLNNLLEVSDISKYEVVNSDMGTIVDASSIKPAIDKIGNIVIRAYINESNILIFEIEKKDDFKVELSEEKLYPNVSSEVLVSNLTSSMSYEIKDTSSNIKALNNKISAISVGEAWFKVIIKENDSVIKEIKYEFSVEAVNNDIKFSLPIMRINKEYQVNVKINNDKLGYIVKPVSNTNYKMSDDGKVYAYNPGLYEFSFLITYNDLVIGSHSIAYYFYDIEIKNTVHDYYVSDSDSMNVKILPYANKNCQLTYESTDNDVLTVNEKGNISFVGVGSAMVIVKEINTGLEKSFSFNVLLDETNITLNKHAGLLELGTGKVNKDKLEAIITTNRLNFDDTLLWSSSNPDIVMVDENGNVEFLGFSNYIIDKVIITSTTINGKKDECVYDLKSYITSADIIVSDIEVAKDEETIIPIEVLPKYHNDNIYVEVENEDILDVRFNDNNLVLFGKEDGNTNIKVQFGEIEKGFMVNVFTPIKGIKFDINKLELKVNEINTLKIISLPDESVIEDNILFASTNPEVLSINNSGTIEALKAGKTNIIAKYNSFEATIVVEVFDVLLSDINFVNLKSTIKVGEIIPIQINFVPNNYTEELTYTYTANSESVDIIDNNYIKGIKSGLATITINFSNGLTKSFDIKVEEDYVNISFMTGEITLDWFATEKLEPIIDTNIINYDKTLSWSIKNYGSNITINDYGIVNVNLTDNLSGYAIVEAITKTNEKAILKINVHPTYETLKSLIDLNLPKYYYLNVDNARDTNITRNLKSNIISSLDSYNSMIIWKSSNPDVLWVDNNGNFGFNKWNESLLKENPKIIATIPNYMEQETQILLDFKIEDVIIPPKIEIKEFETTTIKLNIVPYYYSNGINNIYLYDNDIAKIEIVDNKNNNIHDEYIIVKGLKSGQTKLCINYDNISSCTNLIVNPKYYDDVLISPNNLGQIKGLFTSGSDILINNEDTININNSLKPYLNNDVLGVYSVQLKNGTFTNSLYLTFNLDSKYNNKDVIIYYQKSNGDITSVIKTVKNNTVSIEDAELSTYLILLNDVENPSTYLNYNNDYLFFFVNSILISFSIITIKLLMNKLKYKLE